MITAKTTPQRIEGQIWIDKNSPNRLKYYVNGHEYSVEVSGNYPALPGSTTEDRIIICGSVVKLSTQGYVVEAKFPEDISDIIGVAAKTVVIPADSNSLQIPITKNGWIVLSVERNDVSTEGPDSINEIDLIFEDYASQKDEGYWSSSYWTETPPNGSTHKLDNLIGAPVYWSTKENQTGKLTLSTPSGFYWRIANSNNNISYYNLPQIGNISKINYKNNGSIESIEIHVNFSKFDTTLEWSWPAWGIGNSQPINPVSPNYERSFTIIHGIKFSSKFKPQTLHHITCRLENSEEENEAIVETIEDYNQGTCRIVTSNPYSMKYRVSGEIIFRVNMNIPEPEPEP